MTVYIVFKNSKRFRFAPSFNKTEKIGARLSRELHAGYNEKDVIIHLNENMSDSIDIYN